MERIGEDLGPFKETSGTFIDLKKENKSARSRYNSGPFKINVLRGKN